MKLLVRSMFATVLILTVASQAVRMSHGAPHEAESKVFRGLARLGGHLVATDPDGEMIATIGDCHEAVILLEVGFNGLDDAPLTKLQAMGAAQRYIYLGFVGEEPNLSSIASRWVAASALAVIGLRSGETPDTMMVAELPRACPELTELDWSVLSPWT
jgi:hypothetical protein